jgi:hypothetical protein
MTTKLSDLSVSEVKDIEKKAEKAFKKLIKVKSCLSKGIVPISEEQIQNLTIAGDIYKAPHEIILRCIRVYVDAVCNGDIKVKDYEKTAFEFGYLYAFCFQQATPLNWQMYFLESGDFSEVALVDKNRKFVLFPQMYIYGLFVKDETDNVLLATYNMIKDLDFELAKQTPDNSFSIILC